MRHVTLHFYHANQGELGSLTLDRGGIVRRLDHVVLFGAITGWGSCVFRMTNKLLAPLSNTANAIETDILSIVPFIGTSQIIYPVVKEGLDLRLDDRQQLFASLSLLSGVPTAVHQYITLWFDEFPPDDEPQRDERLAEGRRRLPPRAVSLEAARALIAESEGRLQVPKKPAH